MHGQHSEDRQQKWHMWPGPSQQRPPIGTEADSACANYFFKAGRKIGVGDCALFRADNAPFFIGIIRKLSAEEEGNLKLSVNWLYRFGDIKLGKGASIEAAPNEIFYSFHKDEISAASLLHPCKVAFLQKGVQLPSSVSSFICRRVYDTANKCLYWLTDQDYTDEHQAEVNQLLDRTKHEMQAAAPSEGPSPRATTAPSALKPETANLSVSTQGKGKKRPRTDQNLESTSKREKLVKVEDTDSKRECTMRFEDFTIVADKHEGLTNVSFVDQLFQVMLQERSESVRKPVDVMSHRTMLASIIAATEKEECLTHFVQLGGLRILNDWLQEAHNGKLGDGSPREGDTALEELLLTLIRALEKLPVDLDALKNCIVGKSVNKLRSHRNFEIQKKARELVDMWKKRVNAEMKSSDEVKSGTNIASSWPSRPASETHGTKVRSAKSSAFLKPATNGSTNLVGDIKINLQPIGGHKELSGMAMPKENTVKSHMGANNDVLSAVKEEKSCSSSQSQNNSQSWCSGSGKGGVSWKEEVKALSVAPVSSKSMLRSHGHSTKSHSTVTLTGLQKDSAGRHKIPVIEKTSGVSSLEKGANEGARVENLNNQRLIVRLPNPGRSPSHSVSAGSLVDGGATNNRGSPPGPTSRHDHVTELSPDTNGDAKCGNCNGTSAGKIKEEIDRPFVATTEEADCKPFPMSVENQPKDLIGKCPSDAQGGMAIKVPSSRNSSPERVVLDSVEGGIDLLASVAAQEVSETEKCFSGNTAGEGQPISADSNRDSAITERITSESESNHQKGEKLKQNVPAVCPLEPIAIFEKDSNPVQENERTAESLNVGPRMVVEEKVSEDRALGAATELVSLGNSIIKEVSSSAASGSEAVGCEDEHGNSNLVTENDEKESVSVGIPNDSPVTQAASPSSLHRATSTDEGCKEVERGSPSSTSLANVRLMTSNVGESLECDEEDALEVARQVAKEVEQEVERYVKPEVQDVKAISPCSDIPRCEKVLDHAQPNTLPGDANASLKDGKGMASASTGTLIESIETTTDKGKSLSGRVTGVDQASHHCNNEDTLRHHLEPMIDSMVVAKDVSSVKLNVSFTRAKEESATTTSVVDPELESIVPDKMPSSSKDNICESRDAERPVFDLNEGFDAEEACQAATHSVACAPIPALTCPDSPSGAAAQASPLAAPIAVVAATKGAFIPPSNLTTTKGEVGWKGSAATSAFRPAEPRRMAEASSYPPVDASAAISTSMDVSNQNGKQIRLLDIDLNVADERSIEDSCIVSRLPGGEVLTADNESGASRPELDLNRVDGNDENMGPSMSAIQGTGLSPARSGVLPTTAAPRVILDFDLNDGLGFEETVVEEVSSHQERSAVPVASGMRQNSDLVNVAPWYNVASSMPAAMVIPAFTASRSETSYPALAAPGSKSVVTVGHNFGPFGNDIYRGAAVSSPAVSYAASMPASFSYAGFPFGASFPFTSASYNMGSTSHIASTNSPPFLTTPSQLVSAGAVVSPYGRPYLMGGMRDISSTTESGASWVRPSLDLNSGPDVGADLDAREGVGSRSDVGHSQLSYQQAGSLGGTLKRKEPEGSFDPFRSGFKQTAWR